MAEPIVNFDEHNFIPLLNSDQNLTDRVILNSTENENINLEQELMMVDQIISETNAHHSETDMKDGNVAENISIENEAGHVESPTTGENYSFKCVFCDQVLTSADDPKLLECLHNSCANCINNKLYEQSIGVMDKNAIECPLCNMLCHAEKIIENQFLLDVNNEDNTSKAAELKCSSCTDDSNATSWCVDCSEFICDSCVQAHQRLKITKDHTIKLKEEGLIDNQASSNGVGINLYCSVHPHEKLSLFCENCDKLTCRDCQLIEHREHKYKFTNEIALEARKYISDMLKDVGYKRVLLTSAMKVIDDRQSLIAEKKQALVKEITQLVVKLTNTINVRGKQLVSKLTEVCESKQKTLFEKKQALEQLSQMTDYCITFTQHALDNGSDMALLYSKKQVTEHLKRIKCRRADIPNPEIPVRIHLALDKVPDLVKVMATIGQIVVDGRIYPSQEQSPLGSIPPIGSPSPGHSRPPQQQSPITQILQQPIQTGFQGRPPPYRPPFTSNNQQQYHQNTMTNVHPGVQQNMSHPMHQQQNMQQNVPPNMQQNISPNMQQNMQSNLGLNRIQNMGPPGMVPMSQGILAQQLNNINMHNRFQRSPMQRAMLTRVPNNSLGIGQHQQQVSSSTHPQGMLQDRSALRGLLQPSNPVYVQTGPAQYQAVQPHIVQQYQGRFPGQQQQQQMQYRQPNPARLPVPNQQNRMQQMQPQTQQPQQKSNFHQGGPRWHIPQQTSSGLNSANNRSMTLPTINDNFKITLKQQNYQDSKNPSATVTSTIPKTPSPNHVQGRSDTERNLDKCCEDSVKDLMATIAKLDSNGVQVLAEGRQKSGGSPHVDSSTGDAGPARKIKPESMDTGKDDPNEDWCAVCMDGGELVCCDKCPKVFHQYCHIPNMSVEETGDTWQCLLCMNFADTPESFLGEKRDGELSAKEKKVAERLVLELYCQYDPSLPFREIIGVENIDYHAIIKSPIALDTIRQKLKWDSEERYRNLEDLVRDVRLMFKNAYNYNSVDSLVYNDAKSLEKFFDEQLEKFLPEYAYETFDDETSCPPNKKYRRIIND